MNDTVRQIQSILNAAGFNAGSEDGIPGPRTQAAWNALCASVAGSVAPSGPKPTGLLAGDGSWPWRAFIDGEDIVVTGARATCFGGFDDPQDNGETASGISTKVPGIIGCSLPMDGRMFSGLSKAEHAALDGSPIPRIPWQTAVTVTKDGVSYVFPVIDLGPGKRTGNAIDLTKAAARLFDSNATETDFEMICDVRIIGGAKYAKS